MHRLNRKVEYALMALKHMHKKTPGQLTSAKEISSHYGSPFDVTSRVMQMMAQKGLLKSEQGVQGGYQIVKDLRKVAYSDLLEIILGPMNLTKCIHETSCGCDLTSKCNIISPVNYLNDRLVEFYKNISVHEIISGSRS